MNKDKGCKTFPANIYLFNVNNRNTRKRSEICSKLTKKTPERPHAGLLVIPSSNATFQKSSDKKAFSNYSNFAITFFYCVVVLRRHVFKKRKSSADNLDSR